MLPNDELQELADLYGVDGERAIAGWFASPKFPSDVPARIGRMFGLVGVVAATLATERSAERFIVVITNKSVILEEQSKWTAKAAGEAIIWNESEIAELWFDSQHQGRQIPKLLFETSEGTTSLELANADYDDFDGLSQRIAEEWAPRESL